MPPKHAVFLIQACKQGLLVSRSMQQRALELGECNISIWSTNCAEAFGVGMLLILRPGL